jgi:Na+/proline symporter
VAFITSLEECFTNHQLIFHYIVAKRSLGTGLTAAGVTSSWTWSTTLLSSVTVAYEYGVAGSFYAACNSTQIMVFSNLAIVGLPSQ